jgi:hypothetical protein
LQRNRSTEERYGDQNLPTQPFAPAMAQLVAQGVNIAEALRKRLDSEVERKKITFGILRHARELFGGRTIDMEALQKATQQAAAVVLHKTVTELPGAKEAVAQLPDKIAEPAAGPYDDLQPIDRIFIRSYLEKDIALAKLEMEKQGSEHTTQPATDAPNT